MPKPTKLRGLAEIYAFFRRNEVPIYFLQAKSGGLTGGVTLGWRSDTKAFTASAFVGPVLKLLTRGE